MIHDYDECCAMLEQQRALWDHFTRGFLQPLFLITPDFITHFCFIFSEKVAQ